MVACVHALVCVCVMFELCMCGGLNVSPEWEVNLPRQLTPLCQVILLTTDSCSFDFDYLKLMDKITKNDTDNGGNKDALNYVRPYDYDKDYEIQTTSFYSKTVFFGLSKVPRILRRLKLTEKRQTTYDLNRQSYWYVVDKCALVLYKKNTNK